MFVLLVTGYISTEMQNVVPYIEQIV